MMEERQIFLQMLKCYLLINCKHQKAHTDCVANTAGWARVVTARSGIMVSAGN